MTGLTDARGLAERLIARQPFVAGRRENGTLLEDYFDGHRVLGDPELLAALAGGLHAEIRRSGAEAVAGEISAGSSLATAVALASVDAGRTIECRGIRMASKPYGIPGRLTSPLRPGTRIALVDDVIGTGAALIRSAAAMRECGHVIVGAYVILERDPAVRVVLAEHGVALHALFSLDQLNRLRANTA